MKASVLFVLCVSAAFAEAFHFPRYNPDKSCDCRPLSECNTVSREVKSLHKKDYIVHKAFTKYMEIIRCGFHGREALVCCPVAIPDEVMEIVNNKKYWTNSQEEKGIKKLRCANMKSQSSDVSPKMESGENLFAEPLKGEEKPLECGKYLWREDFLGNRTMIGEYPWLALLEYDTPKEGKKFMCGGALISDQHILTAARCVTSRGNNLTSVILGEYDTNSTSECMDDGGNNPPFCVDSTKRYDIQYSIIHEDFNDGISHRDVMNDGIGPELHDIAIIKLKEKVQLTDYIQPICLPLKKPHYLRFKIAGWGKSFVPENKGFNKKLLSYLTACKRFDYERFDIEQLYDKKEHICAGDTHRREQPCIVDSGGPLMAVERKENGDGRMTVFGVSFMEMTCEDHGHSKDLPAIFTNVYNYKDWIIKHMKA